MGYDHRNRTYLSVTASAYDAGKTRVEYEAEHKEIVFWLANGAHLAFGLSVARELSIALQSALREAAHEPDE